jgi:hypothetical protein
MSQLTFSRNNFTYLDGKPFHVIMNVLKNLRYLDIISYCDVSDYSHLICANPDFWKELAELKYGIQYKNFWKRPEYPHYQDDNMTDQQRYVEIMTNLFDDATYESLDYLNYLDYGQEDNIYKFYELIGFIGNPKLIHHFISERILHARLLRNLGYSDFEFKLLISLFQGLIEGGHIDLAADIHNRLFSIGRYNNAGVDGIHRVNLRHDDEIYRYYKFLGEIGIESLIYQSLTDESLRYFYRNHIYSTPEEWRIIRNNSIESVLSGLRKSNNFDLYTKVFEMYPLS